MAGETKKCRHCQTDIPVKATRCPQCQGDLRIWPARHKILTGIGILVIIGIISSSSSQSNKKSEPAPASTPSSAKSSPAATPAASATPAVPATPVVATRQVTGAAATLGAGTFSGGKDVAVGLYDVTPGSGESGNFFVHGKISYNEILGTTYGMGVPMARVKISAGDSIEISGLSQVIFTPVTTPFVTEQRATTNLYAGTFTVGEDIAAGRYVVTPEAGGQGNFFVHGKKSYNEILGGDYGVPNVSVTLTGGDTVEISGLSQVTFTPSS